MSETHLQLELKNIQQMLSELETKRNELHLRINQIEDELYIIDLLKNDVEKRNAFKRIIEHLENIENNNIQSPRPLRRTISVLT